MAESNNQNVLDMTCVDDLDRLIEAADEPPSTTMDEFDEYLMHLEEAQPLEDYTAVNEKTAEARERMWYAFCE